MIIWVSILTSKKKFTFIRLREEDRQLLKELAKRLDISEADVVKVSIKKLAHELGMDNSS